MFTFERTCVGPSDFVDDLSHPIGTKEGRTLRAFDFTHFFRHFGALIEQLQQLTVEGVDLDAQLAERFGLDGLLAHADSFSNSRR